MVREDYVDFTSAESSHLRWLFEPPTARLVGMWLSWGQDGVDLLVEDESRALMEATPIVPEHTVTSARVQRPG